MNVVVMQLLSGVFSFGELVQVYSGFVECCKVLVFEVVVNFFGDVVFIWWLVFVYVYWFIWLRDFCLLVFVLLMDWFGYEVCQLFVQGYYQLLEVVDVYIGCIM